MYMMLPSVGLIGHALGLTCDRDELKGLAQAKIIKKSLILFWLLNMTI